MQADSWHLLLGKSCQFADSRMVWGLALLMVDHTAAAAVQAAGSTAAAFASQHYAAAHVPDLQQLSPSCEAEQEQN